MIEDQCGHQNASLAIGTLQGKIVTCPLHFSRFDVTTGQKISGPVEAKVGWLDNLPPVIPGLRKEDSQDPVAD
jgi:nitrite reductase/ring-hydroxylating ferredoxin subunit